MNPPLSPDDDPLAGMGIPSPPPLPSPAPPHPPTAPGMMSGGGMSPVSSVSSSPFALPSWLKGMSSAPEDSMPSPAAPAAPGGAPSPLPAPPQAPPSEPTALGGNNDPMTRVILHRLGM